MSMTITILGLGLMGRPMARTLQSAGFAVRGWNRSTLDPHLVEGIPICANLVEAAASEVCLLMLADSTAVDAVLTQLEPHLVPGRLVIDMGTSDPARSRTHALHLTARGIGWIDAPVSGGPEGARHANLAIMGGGSPTHVERARPILNALGRFTHVGPAGAGHTVKIINQLIVGLTIQAVAEGLVLGEEAGVDPLLVQQALAGGFADSKILQIHGTRMAERDYTPGGKVATQLKDLRMARDLADSIGLQLPHLNDTIARYKTLVTQGHANLDHSALHLLLAPPEGEWEE
jgi:2-hydroxy-3-oxopropionate reductase